MLITANGIAAHPMRRVFAKPQVLRNLRRLCSERCGKDERETVTLRQMDRALQYCTWDQACLSWHLPQSLAHTASKRIAFFCAGVRLRARRARALDPRLNHAHFSESRNNRSIRSWSSIGGLPGHTKRCGLHCSLSMPAKKSLPRHAASTLRRLIQSASITQVTRFL